MRERNILNNLYSFTNVFDTFYGFVTVYAILK